MASPQALQVQTHVHGAVSDDSVQLAVDNVQDVLRQASEPVLFARIKLTMMADPAVASPAIAQANVDLNGRPVRAQATGATMRDAIQQMADRLRVRVERSARNWAALRGGQPLQQSHEWRHENLPTQRLPYYPRPAEDRTVIRHKAYAISRETPSDAAAEMELLDYDFHLFTDALTGEDSAIYRTQDGYRLARAHAAPGQPEPQDAPITVSGHGAPRLAEPAAIERLEALGQPFLFFVNSQSGRGNLMYHRYDGHYGLITPASG